MRTEDADYIPHPACSHLLPDYVSAPQPSYECGSGDFGPVFDGLTIMSGPNVGMTHQSLLEAPFQSLDAGSSIDITLPYSDTASRMFSTLQTPEMDDFQETAHALDAAGADRLDSNTEEFCQFWLKRFPGRWPEEPEFAAFQRLTGVSSGKIKGWFVQKLLQTHTTTATNCGKSPSQTPEELSSNLVTRIDSPSKLGNLSNNETGTGLTKFIPDVRHCVATRNRNCFARDASRPFQCTHKCGQKFPRKGEWVKHEQKNHPQRIWLCMIGAELLVDGTRTCSYCDMKNPTGSHLATQHWGDIGSPGVADPGCRKQFTRKDHYLIHLKSVHGERDMERYEPISRVDLPDRLDGWYRWCGFCGSEDCFARWKNRIDHIGRHFKHGKDMRHWQDMEPRASALS